MGNANKNLSKRIVSNDSLPDIFSGGMGEHKNNTDESRTRFADDENGSSEPRRNDGINGCLRCNAQLMTKARYCRECYKNRRVWMPDRPTKRKRIVRRNRSRSRISNDSDMLFRPEKKFLMKGDTRVPNPMYSNLPNRLRTSQSSSSSDSDHDYKNERKIARLERREYFREFQEALKTDMSDISTETTSDENCLCIQCGLRAQNAFLVHDKTAHCCLCYKCAQDLFRRNGPCPECGKKIDHVIRRNVCY